MENYNHFVCIVAGNNPEVLLEKYDSNKYKEKHVVYSFSDAKRIKQNYINMYNNLLKNKDLNEFERITIESDIEDFKEDSDIEFFYRVTQEYEHDEETGDAVEISNPNGKFDSHNNGGAFSSPFVLKNGGEVYKAKKGEINWDILHLNPDQLNIYNAVWELCMEGRLPETPQEQEYYNNMHNFITYFKSFGDKKTYVRSMCSFWGYAFLSEDTEWIELENNQFEWVSNFFDRFIKDLPDDTLLTIFECKRK